MTPEQYQRVRKIFELASERPAGERAAFLDDICPDDPAVRQEVERLLQQRQLEDTDETEVSPAIANRGTSQQPGEGEETIGPYRIRRRIGEGGMGVVYEAVQDQPVRRIVALKVIRQGMDSRQVIARFETERQALALMSHPNIARVLDAGTDTRGRPWFAMEFVKGESLTDYCDRHNLTTEQRLDLMIQVCEGVQHAHHKGIIHRDLKPSNILVEIQDERPVPKIIDFGVAKAISQELTGRTLFTEFGQIIGTPEYMSPEQAEMTGLDVDTRTDVYSLGVLLYEMLVGALPFDSKELRRRGLDEIRRVIREETPPRPSTRLSSLGESSSAVARHRGSDPDTLARRFRGDLDWITMKALDKDRTRRYSTPSEMAMDLRHYLNNEPVTAGPPSVGYRARKFVRRHRLGVAASAALVLMFVVGFAGTAWGWIRAVRAEKQTRIEAATAQQVSAFMMEMFEINDPSEARGREVTAREILDRGTERIRDELQDEPKVRGRLLESMGRVYRSLGLYGDAQPLLEQAVESKIAVHGEMHADVAGALNSLGGLLIRRRLLEEALPVLQRAARIQEEVLDRDDPERARTLNNIGAVHSSTGRYGEARPYFERALEIRERALGSDHPDVAKVLNNLGNVQMQLGDLDAAARSIGRSIEIGDRNLQPDDFKRARLLNTLAQLRRLGGNYANAREAGQRALEIQRKVLQPDHPETVNVLVELALIEGADGNLVKALEHLDAALPVATATGHSLQARASSIRDQIGAAVGDEALTAEVIRELRELRPAE